MAGGDRCYWHSRPDAARDAGAKGGRVGLRRPAVAVRLKATTPDAVAAWLRTLANGLLAGDVDVSRARCAAYLASVVLTATAQRDLAELEVRIKQLEGRNEEPNRT